MLATGKHPFKEVDQEALFGVHRAIVGLLSPSLPPALERVLELE